MLDLPSIFPLFELLLSQQRFLGTVFNGDQRRQERGSECAAEVAGHIEGLREEETTMEDRSSRRMRTR